MNQIIEIMRTIFGCFYLLFLPGFFLTLLFFREKEIDLIERISLSFALSITVIPLLVFYLNLLGMKINTFNVSLVIAVFLSVSGLFIYFQKRRFLKKSFSQK